ncbi:MAG: ArsA family ATPase, partial [Candidatus Aerophobetes bacterium]|nr:ArsA family ATPase [Candidatus Aerophobetes bacterium]
MRKSLVEKEPTQIRGMPNFLANPNLKLMIFGGKGGTGKTTCATATAVYLAKNHPEKRIIVISTDPAHSLGDSFNIAIGNKITPVKENVWGLEIDADELLEEYKARNEEVMRKIADRGTYFDEEDVENFFDKSLPGLDEVMAIIRIANLLKVGEYDLIILDTAPTGHTMVLLSLPQKMEQWVHIMDMLMAKHRYLMKTMVGRYKRDECDEFLDSQMNDIKRVRLLLANDRNTEFVPVTIPEPMSIYEIEKVVKTLKKYRIIVNSIIVNRVIEGDSGCPFCQARRQERKKYMREIEEKFTLYNLVKMPLFPYQIRGMESLTEYSQILFGEREYALPTKVEVLSQVAPLTKGKLSNILEKKLKFVIFG